jgi:hypothetical protein
MVICHTDLSLWSFALASTYSSYTETCCKGFGYHLDLDVALGLIRDIRRVLTQLSEEQQEVEVEVRRRWGLYNQAVTLLHWASVHRLKRTILLDIKANEIQLPGNYSVLSDNDTCTYMVI